MNIFGQNTTEQVLNTVIGVEKNKEPSCLASTVHSHHQLIDSITTKDEAANMAAAVRKGAMNARLCRHFAQRARTFRTSAFHGEISKSAKLSVYGAAVATSLYLGIKVFDKNAVVEAAKPSRRPVCYHYLLDDFIFTLES